MRPSAKAWLAMSVVAMIFSASPAMSVDKAQEAAGAIAAAETVLAEASKAGAEWAIWDKAVPADEDAPSLAEILDVAKEKQKAGDMDEAVRLAKLVDFYAKLGVEQAAVNAQAGIPKIE